MPASSILTACRWPASTNADDRCQGFLDGHGRKNDAAQICLRPALARHGASLLDECTVLRLEAGRDAVKAVHCRWRGRSWRLRGRVVVLAAGALATPGLLLNSAAPRWPKGLANKSGLVGANAAVSLEEIRVRVLCNNAGAGHWGPFERVPPEECERVAYLTAIAPIALARWFLPDLATFPNSAIINVSSPAAYQPIPNLAAYAAAKACLHSFSLALYGEWAGRGVHVQTLVPGPTETAFDATAGSYRCAAIGTERRPPQEVVRASLAYLGGDRPVVTTARGIFRQRLFAGLFPVKLVVRTIRTMFQPLAENP